MKSLANPHIKRDFLCQHAGKTKRWNFYCGAVCTIGDYERYMIIDGKRYCHIFDTKTGYPVDISESGTAIAPTTEEAVILSKYLFIMGAEKYKSGNIDVPVLIIDSNGKVS